MYLKFIVGELLVRFQFNIDVMISLQWIFNVWFHFLDFLPLNMKIFSIFFFEGLGYNWLANLKCFQNFQSV